jgi:hypothetical protein
MPDMGDLAMVLGTEEMAIQQAHRNMVGSSVADMARVLQELLSRRLTAYVAGVKDGKSVTRWANGETDIRYESERRLRTAYEIAQLLASFDSPKIVRGWFVGLNPKLEDISPAEAIHADRLQDALAAARAFIAGG